MAMSRCSVDTYSSPICCISLPACASTADSCLLTCGCAVVDPLALGSASCAWCTAALMFCALPPAASIRPRITPFSWRSSASSRCRVSTCALPAADAFCTASEMASCAIVVNFCSISSSMVRADRPFFARSRRRICRCLICSTDFTSILFPKVEPATLNFCSLNGKSRTTQHKGRHPRKMTAFISAICQSAIGNQPRTTTLRRLPMPSTCTIASSPGSRWPEAFGVPVRITSPGSSVVKLEIAAICSGMP